MFSDDYWQPNICGGFGVVTQSYTLTSSGTLAEDFNGPITCADNRELPGWPDFNEYIPQENGSLLWKFYNSTQAFQFQFRFWKTSCD